MSWAAFFPSTTAADSANRVDQVADWSHHSAQLPIIGALPTCPSSSMMMAYSSIFEQHVHHAAAAAAAAAAEGGAPFDVADSANESDVSARSVHSSIDTQASTPTMMKDQKQEDDEDEEEEEESSDEEYAVESSAAAAASPSARRQSSTNKARRVVGKAAKKKAKRQSSGETDPQRKNHMQQTAAQLIVDELPAAIRPPPNCDLLNVSMEQLWSWYVDPKTAPRGSFLTLVACLSQGLNVSSTASLGGAGQLCQQRIKVGKDATFVYRRETTARASFQKREQHGKPARKGVLPPATLREQAPAPLLLSSAPQGQAALLNVTANLTKILRTKTFPAQMRALRGNEARAVIQAPYGVGSGDKSEIVTLTLAYATDAKAKVTVERAVNFCSHQRITATDADVFPKHGPLPCGCVAVADAASGAGFNVRERVTPICDGVVCEEEAEQLSVYRMRVWKEGPKPAAIDLPQETVVEEEDDNMQEPPAAAAVSATPVPVVAAPATPTRVTGAKKQLKRRASVSVDVPASCSSVVSSSSSSSDSASMHSTPVKRARRVASPSSNVSVAASSSSSSSPSSMVDAESSVTVVARDLSADQLPPSPRRQEQHFPAPVAASAPNSPSMFALTVDDDQWLKGIDALSQLDDSMLAMVNATFYGSAATAAAAAAAAASSPSYPRSLNPSARAPLSFESAELRTDSSSSAVGLQMSLNAETSQHPFLPPNSSSSNAANLSLPNSNANSASLPSLALPSPCPSPLPASGEPLPDMPFSLFLGAAPDQQQQHAADLFSVAGMAQDPFTADL